MGQWNDYLFGESGSHMTDINCMPLYVTLAFFVCLNICLLNLACTDCDPNMTLTYYQGSKSYDVSVDKNVSYRVPFNFMQHGLG